jgi:hypothetical protein
MTDLSPAAEAVLHAVTLKQYDVPYYACPASIDQIKSDAAAALRAAADQVVPHLEEPDWGVCNNGHCDIELYTDHQRKRTQLLAIAAELDNNATH